MERKIVLGIMLALLFIGMLTLAFNVQQVEASSEETVVHYTGGYITNGTSSYNDTDPVSGAHHFSAEGNWTFSPPDANGVINITLPKESHYAEPSYNPISKITVHYVLISDFCGKMYTLNDTGDVDITSMTNDTGTFFRKDETWHQSGEEWIGDGTPDLAGSAWFTGIVNVSVYLGNGTDELFIGSYSHQFWLTTGFSENTVIEPNSRLNGSYINATGKPFSAPYVGGIGTWVYTSAKLNIPWQQGKHLDLQGKTDQLVVEPPAFTATLFSPANLYVTDPMNRHIGAHPTTGESINEIPGAFYSEPGSHPQRIVIPDQVDGVYDIKIVGTSGGTYTLVVELATLEKTTTHTYTGDITSGQILISEANISEGEMTSTQPVGSFPVGGIYLPVDKLALLAPYIALASIILVATAATAIYVKRRKKKQ